MKCWDGEHTDAQGLYAKREGREGCAGEGASQDSGAGGSLIDPEGSRDEAEESLWRIENVSSLPSLDTRGER